MEIPSFFHKITFAVLCVPLDTSDVRYLSFAIAFFAFSGGQQAGTWWMMGIAPAMGTVVGSSQCVQNL